MKARYFWGSALFILSGPLTADTLDLALSDQTIEAAYAAPWGRQSSGSNELLAHFLHNNDKDATLFGGGMRVTNEVGTAFPGLHAALGLEAFAGRGGDEDVLGVAITAGARYTVPAAPRLSLAVNMALAPDVITTGAEGLIEYGARVEYDLLPQAVLFLGYRKTAFKMEKGPDITLIDGSHVGLRFKISH